MGEASRALAPHLYPEAGRSYFGFCNKCHSELWLDDEAWKRLKVAVAPKPATEPVGVAQVVPLMMPCGDILEFRKRLYRNSDGTFIYR